MFQLKTKFGLHRQFLLVLLCFLSHSHTLFAQSPGQIVRPVGGNGVTVLNPDGNGFSSASAAGFVTNDISESEISFKIVPPAVIEPTGDVATGPSGGFTDIVQTVDGSGFYVYTDGTNIMFRLRIGGIISGSKGYSILLDTDGRMGNAGPAADPNYIGASSTSKGNPGFEYEVVLQTNFQVAVYAIDGLATPGSPIHTFSLSTHSQISRALSFDGNNPDYFYDWYVPVSAIGSPATLRMVATTVTSPNSALQGSRSDIYGIDDDANASESAAWQTVVNAQPAVSLASFNGVAPVCTAAPVLGGGISVGANVNVTGTWTRMDVSKPSSAIIHLYKNGVLAGTTNASSGGAWSVTVTSVSNGDVFHAKAMASGESECLSSNQVTASSCLVPPAAPVVSCASLKGISGTMPSRAAGNSVLVYQVSAANANPFTTLVSTGTNITYPTDLSFSYYTNQCSGGNNNVATGVYMILVQNGSCTSAASYVCVNSGSSGAPAPLASNAILINGTLYPSTSVLTGSGATSGDVLRLFVNGFYRQSVTASGSSFSFSGLSLKAGDQLRVYAQSGTNCITQSAVFTVRCYTQEPVISTNPSGQLLVGATIVSGTSAYPGASVALYKGAAPGTAVGTASTVTASGSWSVSVPSLASGEVYYAMQTVNGCTSAASGTATVFSPAACPSISGSYTAASTSISGTTPGAFTGTIRVYLDGDLLASGVISGAATWSVVIPSGRLYYGGMLTSTAQVAGGAESSGCGSVTIQCTSSSSPSVTPASRTITEGEVATFTVGNVLAGNWYALADNEGESYATAIYATTAGSFSLSSGSFTVPGNYNLALVADDLSGCPSTSVPISVLVQSATLPVRFVSFSAKRTGSGVLLNWDVADETNVQHYEVQRAVNCGTFETIAIVPFRPAGSLNNYTHLDAQPPMVNNICYRIRQVDKGSGFTYSSIASVTNAGELQWRLSPNPVAQGAKLYFVSAEKRKITITVSDVAGRIILNKNMDLAKGEHSFSVPELNGLVKGTYIITVKHDNLVEFQKIVKE